MLHFFNLNFETLCLLRPVLVPLWFAVVQLARACASGPHERTVGL
jgi:hypothetical protein